LVFGFSFLPLAFSSFLFCLSRESGNSATFLCFWIPRQARNDKEEDNNKKQKATKKARNLQGCALFNSVNKI